MEEVEVEGEKEAAVDVAWDCSISPGGVRYRAPRCANETHVILTPSRIRDSSSSSSSVTEKPG